MPSNHLILHCLFLLLPSIFPSIGVFSNESTLCIRWPKYQSFTFNITPSNEYSELISFRFEKWKWNHSIMSDSCDPMDRSLPNPSIHGIFQARILEWVAISFSRRPLWPRDWTWVSHIVGRCFTIWATREVPFRINWFDILAVQGTLKSLLPHHSLQAPSP